MTKNWVSQNMDTYRIDHMYQLPNKLVPITFDQKNHTLRDLAAILMKDDHAVIEVALKLFQDYFWGLDFLLECVNVNLPAIPRKGT